VRSCAIVHELVYTAYSIADANDARAHGPLTLPSYGTVCTVMHMHV
jgi:hypothetical protein